MLQTLVQLHGEGAYAAFLDVQKAFDSIDHWHLLDVLRTRIGLSAHWLEIIRRLLLDQYTMVFNQPIPVERGTFQGSPLSPLLCVLFLGGGVLRLAGAIALGDRRAARAWREVVGFAFRRHVGR